MRGSFALVRLYPYLTPEETRDQLEQDSFLSHSLWVGDMKDPGNEVGNNETLSVTVLQTITQSHFCLLAATGGLLLHLPFQVVLTYCKVQRLWHKGHSLPTE